TARHGVARETPLSQGLTVALHIDGVTLVVCSRRLQALAVEQLEIAGVDFARIRTVVVKSRGHYQASFCEFFDRGQMHDIAGTGWTSEDLTIWPYRRIKLPLYPYFGDPDWSSAAPFDFARAAPDLR
ncbi:MAG TPA: MlrC C-terminal domain-containing protein, partial [Rhizomicrobium sp.]